MARKHVLGLVASLALLQTGWAQTAEPSPASTAEATPSSVYPRLDDAQAKKMREQFEKLSPEQREHIARNFKRLKDLPSEQKERLRAMGEEKKKRFKKAVDDSVAASGLQLDDQQRAKFTGIYMKKRGDMERQLRQEMDAKREKLLPELNRQVLEQYQQESSAKVEATPSPSVTP